MTIRASAFLLVLLMMTRANAATIVPPPATPNPPVTDPNAKVSVCDLSGNTYRSPKLLELDARLLGCPRLAGAVHWMNGETYFQLSATQRQTIDRYFRAYLAGVEASPVCPNASTRLDRAGMTYLGQPYPYGLYYRAGEAFDVFAANIAHQLWLEATHGVPWSLDDFSDRALRTLFDARLWFEPLARLPAADQLRIRTRFTDVDPSVDYRSTNQGSTENVAGLCDPRRGYAFVARGFNTSGTILLGDNLYDTLRKLTAWLSLNVAHGGREDYQAGRVGPEISYLDQQLAPVALGSEPAHVTALFGCHSAARLLIELTRAVNLPLELVAQLVRAPDGIVGGHAGLALRLRWETRILQHVDLAYAMENHPDRGVDAGTHQRLSNEASSWSFFYSIWPTLESLRLDGWVFSDGSPQSILSGSLALATAKETEVMFDTCGARLTRSVCNQYSPLSAFVTSSLASRRPYTLQELQLRGGACNTVLGGCARSGQAPTPTTFWPR